MTWALLLLAGIALVWRARPITTSEIQGCDLVRVLRDGAR